MVTRMSVATLKNNAKMALARLHSLKRMKSFTPELRNQYEMVFLDWVKEGYVTELPIERLREENSWLLPHFPVLKEDAVKKKKVRPVFDGPAEFNGQSLSSQCLPGPNMIGDLNKIILRFRKKTISLVSDNKDMFLNILLDEESSRYHCFVWQNGNGPLRLDLMQSHSFGNPGSPGVANFHVRKIAEENRIKYPEAAESIIESTLMDDSADSHMNEGRALKALQDLKESKPCSKWPACTFTNLLQRETRNTRTRPPYL